MALVPPEPQVANDYDDRTTEAVKMVLVELGQLLGSYINKFTVVGGSVPWLLFEAEEMKHVGTGDLDLSLDAEALGDGEYAKLIECLLGNGYEQDPEGRYFQLVRRVDLKDGGDPVSVVIDFLMPRDAIVEKNKPPLVEKFAVQRASGAELALGYKVEKTVFGRMPGGGFNTVRVSVATLPAFLAMKGHALGGRLKQKDAYDVYYCIRNFEGGPLAAAEACRPALELSSAKDGYALVAEKFQQIDGYGPTSVRNFVEGSAILGERTPDEWQTDAFYQVDAFLRALGLR